MTQKKSVLLVDPNSHESRAVFAALVRAGHSVTDTHRADYALDLLADRSFEVAIVDLVATAAGHDDLVQKLAGDWSNPLIIGIADFASLVAQKATVRRGMHHFMSKPVDIPRLVKIVSQEEAVQNPSKGADILGYVRCLMETGQNAVLEISDLHGHTCKIVVADSTVIHAEYGETEGEQAFRQALGFEGGVFAHMPWSEPPRITIHQFSERLFCKTCDSEPAETEKPEHL